MTAGDQFHVALRDSLPPAALIFDPDVMRTYRQDRAFLLETSTPSVVALPASTDEVCTAMRLAARWRVPVVPRGAGSGLSGGANAVHGCMVMATTRMNRILDLDVANRLAVVEAGVINATLAGEAEQVDLMYPPDPSSWEFSTLGGNLATNAGGLCCVKYGVTREWCMGLEVVLAGGTALRTGRRSVKGVAGYDLTALFIGSEGTLGVITQATLRLRPRSALPVTLVAAFPTLDAAGGAVADITRRSVPSLLEVMDRTTVRAINDWRNAGLDGDSAALLFVQSDAGEGAAAELLDAEAACRRAGASTLVRSSDDEESRMLIGLRRMALSALERLGATLLDDVAVPCAALPAMMAEIETIGVRHGITVATFGHAGDGNLHPTLVWDDGDPGARPRALRAFDDIVAAALRYGGTVTGEHGVGRLKRSQLATELGSAGLAVHRAVKAAFDPQGLLNPGALF